MDEKAEANLTEIGLVWRGNRSTLKADVFASRDALP